MPKDTLHWWGVYDPIFSRLWDDLPELFKRLSTVIFMRLGRLTYQVRHAHAGALQMVLDNHVWSFVYEDLYRTVLFPSSQDLCDCKSFVRFRHSMNHKCLPMVPMLKTWTEETEAVKAIQLMQVERERVRINDMLGKDSSDIPDGIFDFLTSI